MARYVEHLYLFGDHERGRFGRAGGEEGGVGGGGKDGGWDEGAVPVSVFRIGIGMWFIMPTIFGAAAGRLEADPGQGLTFLQFWYHRQKSCPF